jgi:hypothetical protein
MANSQTMTPQATFLQNTVDRVGGNFESEKGPGGPKCRLVDGRQHIRAHFPFALAHLQLLQPDFSQNYPHLSGP